MTLKDLWDILALYGIEKDSYSTFECWSSVDHRPPQGLTCIVSFHKQKLRAWWYRKKINQHIGDEKHFAADIRLVIPLFESRP